MASTAIMTSPLCCQISYYLVLSEISHGNTLLVSSACFEFLVCVVFVCVHHRACVSL